MPDAAPPGRRQAAAGAPAPERAAAERDLGFNYAALLVHGLLGQTGFRLVQAPTFLPYFVSELAGNRSAVGIVRAIQSLGMVLSPLFSAGLIERRHHVKGMGILFGGAMRLQILFLALIALLAPTEYALMLVWVALGLLGLALGGQGVVFNFLLSKTIPPERRGVLLGLRNAVAGAVLIAVSYVGGWLVDRHGFPDGYGYTFLVGFVLTTLGLVAFACVREPASQEPRGAVRISRRLLEIGLLFESEPSFRRFLDARLLGTAARGVIPLYIVLTSERFGISGGRLATLTVLFTLAQSGSSLLWGAIADRWGYKGSMIGALASWILGSTLLLVVPRIETIYVVFFLVGAGLGGFQLASQNLVLEFGGESDRPLRIATSNSLSELVGTLGFLAAGFAADSIALEAVFGASILLQLLAILRMRTMEEPRRSLRELPGDLE